MTVLSGKCLCGAVSVTAEPEDGTVSACHCTMCRKWTAGPFMAMGCGDSVKIEAGDSLSVYQSSDWAERAFCKHCGTSVAWRLRDGGSYHVSSQLFEEADKMPLSMQVFIDEKPDNYSFKEQTKTMMGAEIFAMFAPPEGQ